MGIIKTGILASLGALLFFGAAPTSTNFTLQSYGIGSGGSSNTSSTNYQSQVISGEQGSVSQTSTTYKTGSGLIPTQQADVPAAPTITNPSNYYNKLHIVIDTGNNPTDATFAIAISADAFATTTNYVKSDFTVGASLTNTDWLTYSGWGSASGFDVIGLLPNTTYTIKVKARHGVYTDSPYSATAAASTVGATLTFDIDTATTDISTNPPYAVNFTSLLPNTVVNSTEKIWVSLDTNAQSGGTVFISSANAGLKSTAANNTIVSASANLSVATTGYGAQSASATQSSGGPLTVQSPYNGASQNVGILDTTLRPAFISSAPITAGRGSLQLMARATSNTPAGNDYSDVLTLIAAASF